MWCLWQIALSSFPTPTYWASVQVAQYFSLFERHCFSTYASLSSALQYGVPASPRRMPSLSRSLPRLSTSIPMVGVLNGGAWFTLYSVFTNR